MTRAAIGLGSNVGDRAAHLAAALGALAAAPGVRVEAVSPVYETEAHVRPGQPPQPDHLNAAAVLTVDVEATGLLRVLQRVERAAGRDPRAEAWSPRVLDLDLLLWGDAPVDLPGLVVPHPRLAARRFVLAPLADVAPGWRVPGLGATVADLLAACADASRVRVLGAV